MHWEGKMVGLPGIEPGTYGLGNRRSVQLSYNPIDCLINR